MNNFSKKDSDKIAYLHIMVIVIVWIAMVCLVNPFGNFPINDDWVYGLAVKSILENGYYHFPSPASANVGPQVFWGALFCVPFGFSFTALRISTLTLGLIGVLTFYLLIKKLSNESNFSIISSLSIAVNPIYFGLSNSFMTDIPFIAISIISIYFLVSSFFDNSRYLMLLGLTFAVASILIRQLGLVIIVGYALAGLKLSGLNRLSIVRAISLIIGGAFIHLIYQDWLVSSGRTPKLLIHSDIRQLVPSLDGLWGMKMVVVNMLLYVGMFILPVAILLFGYKFNSQYFKNVKIIRSAIAIPTILFIGIIWWFGKYLPSASNILIQSGMGPLTLRDTYILTINYPVVPQAITIFWIVMTLLSIFSIVVGVYYAGLIVVAAHSDEKNSNIGLTQYIVLIFLASTLLIYSAVLVFVGGRIPIFDRYFLFIAPLAILILANFKLIKLTPRFGGSLLFPYFIIIVFSLFSIAATHDYLAFNRTRWQALHDLMDESKVSPNGIDGGYEFNGWFLNDTKYITKDDKSWWWVDGDEYVISSGTIHGYVEIRRYEFERWLLMGDSDIFVLKKLSSSNGKM